MFDTSWSKSSVTSIILSIYIIAIAVALPSSYHSEMEVGVCYSLWPNPEQAFSYYLIFAMIAMIIPLMITAIIYSWIIHKVASTSKKHRHSFSETRRKENSFIYKTMMCTALVYSILIAPYAIFLIVYTALMAFAPMYFKKHSHWMVLLNYVIFTLSATNSCANPLIYAKRNTKWIWRSAFFRKIVNCKKGRKCVTYLSNRQTSLGMLRSNRGNEESQL